MKPTPTNLARLATVLGMVVVVGVAQPGTESFFNGKDLTGWKGNDGYWSVQDRAIVGHSDKDVPRNEFIWSHLEVKDFYLAVDVKLTPDGRNAGIQFRSKPVNASGQALGYQADVGSAVWGKLYHEHGRGKLDWNDRGLKAVKPGEWNRYEILAVGHRIWLALNGKLCVAIHDPKGELSGRIAFQVHSGPPQTVRYRIAKLVRDPPVALATMNEAQLLDALPDEDKAKTPQPKPAWTPQLAAWRNKLDANDPGMAKAGGQPWFAPKHDDAAWKAMGLPGHWEDKGLPGCDGTVWYRKDVEIPSGTAGTDLVLELGPIDDMDMTWFNGVQVGGIERPGYWATPRKYVVSGKLVKAGRNVIAVRVLDHGWSGGFAGKPVQMRLRGKDTDITLAGPWRYKVGVHLKALGLGALQNPGPPPAPPPVPEKAPLLRPLERPDSPVPGFSDGFRINHEQTIVILGGTNALASGKNGYLETLLTAAHPEHRLRFRNMAWQADTVHRQQRPRNFYAKNKPGYGERDGRKTTRADIVFFWMGQTESLHGPQNVGEFARAYAGHLDQLASYTHRVVLVTPVPFLDPLGVGIDVEERNRSLATYVDAIKQIGRARSLPVVDLFSAFRSANPGDASSQNGVHLTASGHWFAATTIATQLGVARRVPPVELRASDATLKPAAAESLRRSIVQKNELWFRYWRPTNWAFLYGNRQSQPSSRDHRNGSHRWFPEELRSLLDQINQADATVHGIASKLASQR
ncbi:MAG: family 16 glycoside hydrolase [Planctomycetota bacterium]|nr:family 16 glycoside hydrolase [Planctomycetota bacterium]